MTEIQNEVLEAPQLPTPKIEEDKWLREKRAFFRMLPDLLRAFRGKWVAIHHEQVIEVGDSLHDVLSAAGERLPKTEIYIQLVDEKLPVVKMLSPHKRLRNIGSRSPQPF